MIEKLFYITYEIYISVVKYEQLQISKFRKTSNKKERIQKNSAFCSILAWAKAEYFDTEDVHFKNSCENAKNLGNLLAKKKQVNEYLCRKKLIEDKCWI